MFWPISAGTLFGAIMSSERSTFVRRWPSVPDLLAFERGEALVTGIREGRGTGSEESGGLQRCLWRISFRCQ